MPEKPGHQRDQVEHALLNLREWHNCEPALQFVRRAIASCHFLHSVQVPSNDPAGSPRTLVNQVVMPKEIVPILEALTDPGLRLVAKMARRGRPPSVLKRLEIDARNYRIVAAVHDAIAKRLEKADGTKSIVAAVELERIYHEVGKTLDIKIKGDTVRKIFANSRRVARHNALTQRRTRRQRNSSN